MANMDGEEIGKIISKLFSSKKKSEELNEKDRRKFIINVILTYRLKPEDIMELFGLSEKDVYDYYNSVYPDSVIFYTEEEGNIKINGRNPIEFCLKYDYSRTGGAFGLGKDDVLQYFVEIRKNYLAYALSSSKNDASAEWFMNELKKLILSVSDYKFIEARKAMEKRKNEYIDNDLEVENGIYTGNAVNNFRPGNIPDEIKELMITYQNKYGLTTELVANFFYMEQRRYIKAIHLYLESHTDSPYADMYQSCTEYNKRNYGIGSGAR